jgi:hypothetical protein
VTAVIPSQGGGLHDGWVFLPWCQSFGGWKTHPSCLCKRHGGGGSPPHLCRGAHWRGESPPPSCEGVVIAIAWQPASNIFFLFLLFQFSLFNNLLFKDNCNFVRDLLVFFLFIRKTMGFQLYLNTHFQFLRTLH